MNTLETLKLTIRNIPDFPKPGIMFKDITPLLRQPELCKNIARLLAEPYRGNYVDIVAGIESRGFLFGMMLAQELNCPFAIIRKKGKLPYKTIEMEYALEYGTATIEIHEDELKVGSRVLIHDDLLATGGTADAAAQLIEKVGGKVAGFSFVIGLDFLAGRKRLESHTRSINTLINY